MSHVTGGGYKIHRRVLVVIVIPLKTKPKNMLLQKKDKTAQAAIS